MLVRVSEGIVAPVVLEGDWGAEVTRLIPTSDALSALNAAAAVATSACAHTPHTRPTHHAPNEQQAQQHNASHHITSHPLQVMNYTLLQVIKFTRSSIPVKPFSLDRKPLPPPLLPPTHKPLVLAPWLPPTHPLA